MQWLSFTFVCCFFSLFLIDCIRLFFVYVTLFPSPYISASWPSGAPKRCRAFLSRTDNFPSMTHRFPPAAGDWPWFPWGGTAGRAHSGCRGSWHSWAGAQCWCRARCRAPPCSCEWCPGTSSCPIGRQKVAFKRGPTCIWICNSVQGELQFQVPGRPSGHIDKPSYKYTERRGHTMAGSRCSNSNPLCPFIKKINKMT